MNKEIIETIVDAIDVLNRNVAFHTGFACADCVTERLRKVLDLLNEDNKHDADREMSAVQW